MLSKCLHLLISYYSCQDAARAEQAASARVGDGVAGSVSSAGDTWGGHREGGVQ